MPPDASQRQRQPGQLGDFGSCREAVRQHDVPRAGVQLVDEAGPVDDHAGAEAVDILLELVPRRCAAR